MLDRSRATFETEALEPFYVKGKRHPVEAFAVGAVQRRVETGVANLPLVGRDAEIAVFTEALDALRSGSRPARSSSSASPASARAG